MNESLSKFHQLLLDKGIAFVRYSLPQNANAVTLVSFNPMSFKDLNYLADNQDEGFVFAPFVISDEFPIWFLKADDVIDEKTDLQSIEKKIRALPDIIKKFNPIIESTSKLDYELAFEAFKRELDSGNLDKVILSKIITEAKTNEPVMDMFTRLSEAYPKAFTYLIYLPGGEIWAGATPELLLSQDEKGIQTMALAGTQILKNKKPEGVIWDKKEIEEQAYVRNYVRKVLASVSESVNVSNTYTARAGNLVHLRTDFSLNQVFNRSNIIEIVKNLHPTPAVCGIPLEESKSSILNTEQHNRAYYTGFLGPVKAASISLFVNLRCMQVLREKYALYVGGGITRDSELEKEWAETEAKAQTLLAVID